MEGSARYKILFPALIAALGWFALALQFYVAMANRSLPLADAIINFFSFYTILCNILIGICFICICLRLRGAAAKFLTSQQMQCALTIYIVVVGLIYNFVLRGLIRHAGWARAADELLHLVIPILTLIYWIFISPKSSLRPKNVIKWTIFPFIYFFYTYVHGKLSGFYPYPFVNVQVLGKTKVLMNSLLMIAGFILLSFLFIAARRWLPQGNSDKS